MNESCQLKSLLPKKRKAKAGSGGDYISEHIVDQNYWRVTPKVIMDC